MLLSNLGTCHLLCTVLFPHVVFNVCAKLVVAPTISSGSSPYQHLSITQTLGDDEGK